MNARVRQTGSLHASQATTLQTLPVIGKIKAGIKVLTKKAAAIPAVKKAYVEGLEAGAAYVDIERACKAAAQNCPPYPLTPRNAPFFRVHPSDFVTPGSAEKIMKLYATTQGDDPKPRLYSFPIVMPSDNIDLVFREQFEAWNRSELLHWSEDGQCMQRKPLTEDRNRRRRFGARPVESVGPCNPNDCNFFNEGQCQHMASLYFWVPGITGVGVVELEFRSIYASIGIMEILQMVQMGLGRIRGLVNGRPIFQLSKIRRDVSVIDWTTGKAKRQGQHIISLEAPGLDMVQVLASQDQDMLTDKPERVQVRVARLEHPADQDVDTMPEKIIPPEIDPDEPDDSGLDATSGPTDHGPYEDLYPSEIANQVHAPSVVDAREQAQESAQADESQPPATPIPELTKKLRRRMQSLRKKLRWTDADLMEWITGNGGTAQDAYNDEKLKLMIDKLDATVRKSENLGEAPF